MPFLRASKSDNLRSYSDSFRTRGDNVFRVNELASHSHHPKNSVVDYYNPFTGYLNASPSVSLKLSPNNPPPSYYETLDPPSRQPVRAPILPREEEGQEKLPKYNCSIHREAVFYTKIELSSPFDRAPDRSWNKEYVVLHGTLLRIHKPKRVPFFATPEMRSGQGEDGSTRPEGWMPGELLRSYTLQGAEVGVANDYKKRHFVIRVRAETEQFLLSSKSCEELMAWLDSLSAAVDLSPALDERTLPRHQTLPGRRRRRGREIIEEQRRIIQQQFPHIISAVPGEENYQIIHHLPHSNSHESISELALGELRSDFDISTTPTMPNTQGVASPLSVSSLDSSSAAFTTSSVSSRRERLRDSPSTCPAAPSTEQTAGKWRPSNTLTPEANLRYARRCMAILYEDSPRQSDYIVKDGKRYRLAWDTRKLVPAWDLESRNGYPSDEGRESAGALPQYGDVADTTQFVVGSECRTTSSTLHFIGPTSSLEAGALGRIQGQVV